MQAPTQGLAGTPVCVCTCVSTCVSACLWSGRLKGPAGRFDYYCLEASGAKELWFLVGNVTWQGKGG